MSLIIPSLSFLSCKVRYKGMTVVLLSCVFLLACSKPQAINRVPFNNQVSVSISSQKQVRLGQAVNVSFIIKNGTKQPIQFLKWGTPLEGQLTRNSFRVTHQKSELPYQGRLFKRAKPSNKDFITLQPLTSLQANINLSTYYPISRTGQYSVTYRASYLTDKNNSLIKLKDSNLLKFSITEPHK